MIIKFFGIAKDITGKHEFALDETGLLTIRELRKYLKKEYPAIGEISHYMVAVNMEYADDEYAISENDIIAVIPPVSGG